MALEDPRGVPPAGPHRLPPADLEPDLVEQPPGSPNEEICPRSGVAGIFPDRNSVIRLVGAVLAEQCDESALSSRYLGLDIASKSRTALGSPTEQESTPAALTA